MMLKIGEKEFKFKKDALNYYKKILNSYDFGEMLKDEHYNDIIDLLNYDISFSDNHPKVEERENEEEADNEDYIIENIRIGKVQFNTKCFELLYRNLYIFKDNELFENFRKYHKEKAVLRIVRKECNSSRAHQGRLKEQKKDLRIKN